MALAAWALRLSSPWRNSLASTPATSLRVDGHIGEQCCGFRLGFLLQDPLADRSGQADELLDQSLGFQVLRGRVPGQYPPAGGSPALGDPQERECHNWPGVQEKTGPIEFVQSGYHCVISWHARRVDQRRPGSGHRSRVNHGLLYQTLRGVSSHLRPI